MLSFTWICLTSFLISTWSTLCLAGFRDISKSHWCTISTKHSTTLTMHWMSETWEASIQITVSTCGVGDAFPVNLESIRTGQKWFSLKLKTYYALDRFCMYLRNATPFFLYFPISLGRMLMHISWLSHHILEAHSLFGSLVKQNSKWIQCQVNITKLDGH